MYIPVERDLAILKSGGITLPMELRARDESHITRKRGGKK